ncbi:MAG: NUDIX domain-containing protein [Spirochaetales bacterium]|nr:NUDIX domain-containing protein [Spirochaetales bacterium]
MRKKTFIFPVRCPECGAVYPLKQILYYDKPSCPRCSPLLPEEAGIPDRVDGINWDTWVPSETAVLCFIEHEGKVLLIHKKTGLGAGKINAPGGRIEAGETPYEAAVRETREETGLVPSGLEERVRLYFQFKDGYSLKGHVFYATGWSGELTETEEADPFWCSVSDIPYERMWADDILWLPGMLEGRNMQGRFIFDGDQMIDQQIEVVESLP